MQTFNEIYSEYYSYVLNFISQKVSRDVAEELTNDVFMKVNNNLDRFNPEKSKMSTWIISIAKNAIIDNFRKVKLQTTSIEAMVDDEGKEFY